MVPPGPTPQGERRCAFPMRDWRNIVVATLGWGRISEHVVGMSSTHEAQAAQRRAPDLYDPTFRVAAVLFSYGWPNYEWR